MSGSLVTLFRFSYTSKYVKVEIGYEFSPGELTRLIPYQLSCALGRVGAAPAEALAMLCIDGRTKFVLSAFSTAAYGMLF